MTTEIDNPLDSVFTPAAIGDPHQHALDAVAIDEGNLRTEMVRLPSDLAHYGHRFALANKAMVSSKMNFEEISAMVYLETRETLEDLSDKGKKPTEATIDARCKTDHRVRDARALMIEAEFEREQVKSHVDAVRAKRDMLIALGALARAEMGPTSMREIPGA